MKSYTAILTTGAVLLVIVSSAILLQHRLERGSQREARSAELELLNDHLNDHNRRLLEKVEAERDEMAAKIEEPVQLRAKLAKVEMDLVAERGKAHRLQTHLDRVMDKYSEVVRQWTPPVGRERPGPAVDARSELEKKRLLDAMLKLQERLHPSKTRHLLYWPPPVGY